MVPDSAAVLTRRITIHTQQRQGSCPHFWQAAGDDTAFAWTLDPCGQTLLDEIARTRCIRWFRNHHALSQAIRLPDGRLVRAYSEDAEGRPHYDFSGLDAVYDRWLAVGMKPIVELDFLPEELCEPGKRLPRNTPEMWEKWRGLLRAFIIHLQQRYGVAETRSWYFEDWNEPDFWPRARLNEFFRLHDEAVAALESVDQQLRIGGPAAIALPFCDQFMQQITFGKNQVTGGIGSRCDYISLHQYGVSGNTLTYHPALVPSPQDIAARCYWLYETMSVFPGMRGKEFHLNEWGMVSHFEKTAYEFPPLEIRNSEHFPLFMFKLVHQLFTLADHRGDWLPTIMLLWAGAAETWYAKAPESRASVMKGRSGLFAGNRSLTTAHGIFKPIFRGFELLARLGDQRLAVSGGACGERAAVLATHGDGAIQALAYVFAEDGHGDGQEVHLDLVFTDLGCDGPAEAELTRLDRQHANAYRLWEQLGRPEEPDAATIERLRNASQLVDEEPIPIVVRDGRATLGITIPNQGAVLLVLRPRDGAFPPPTAAADRRAITTAIA